MAAMLEAKEWWLNWMFYIQNELIAHQIHHEVLDATEFESINKSRIHARWPWRRNRVLEVSNLNWVHMLIAMGQSRRQCRIVSSTLLQIAHTTSVVIPCLKRQAFVGSASWMANQMSNTHFKGIFNLQIHRQFKWWPETTAPEINLLLIIQAYPVVVEYTPVMCLVI